MPAPQHTRLSRILLGTLFVLACALTAVAPALAAPQTAEIRKAQADAEQARERLDDLAAELEERTEDYLEIEDELARTRALISRTESELEAALRELDRAEVRLNGRASAIYRNGSIDVISVFVGATDFRDLVTRIDLMRRIGHTDASLVAAVKDAKVRIESTQTSLERRREEQTVLRDRARDAQSSMRSAVTRQQEYLETLDSRVKKLVAQEKARQERLARERAAAAARLAAQSGGVGRAGRDFDPNALGAPHPEAVAVARRFVDKVWYQWGGTTPAGFDCSGLVLYCYREIGVSLPRTSRQQYRVGAYIPPDRLDLLEPGDLVFFGRDGDPNRVHHVGMYIGGGSMIHAPQTGEKVSVGSLTGRIASRGDYVGAVRP